MPIWVYLLGAVLTSGILSAAVSWRVALAAAAKQADATMAAARDQAAATMTAARNQADAAIEAAREQAKALVESARKQSVETEMLRLRHQVVGHRYRRWRSVADRMWDIVVGRVDETPPPLDMLLMAADLKYTCTLVGAPEEYLRVVKTASAFIDEWYTVLDLHEKEHGPTSPMRRKGLSGIIEPLLNFMMVVDWAAEKRLERRLSEPLSDMALRIDEMFRKVKALET